MGLSFAALSSIALKNKLTNKYADKFIKRFFYSRTFIKANNEFNLFNPIKHEITSLDGEVINCFEIKNNILNNYIFIVSNLDYSINDSLNFIKGFGEYGYNFVVIPLRDLATYGIKESYDLIEWINYFSNINNDINIVLFGEGIGANTIIKALFFKNLPCVKCAILDQPITTLKEKLLKEFTLDNDIKDNFILEKCIDSKLKDKFNFSIDQLNINNSLMYNSIPLCFVYNKANTKNNYFDFLKIYNENKSENKILFTNIIDRNYKEKNYFKILNSYIINY